MILFIHNDNDRPCTYMLSRHGRGPERSIKFLQWPDMSVHTTSYSGTPLYQDSPEMRTSPLTRTPSSTVPATKIVYKTTPELNEDTSLNQDIDTLSCPKGWLEKFHSDSFILDTTHNIMLTLVHTKSCKHSYTHTRCKSVTLIKTSY